MGENLDERGGDWGARPWLLASICAVAGLAFHALTDHDYQQPLEAWRQAAATFVAIATIAFVLTVERSRWTWSVAFAAAWGLVIALVGWSTAQYNLAPTIFEWPFLSAIFAVLIAAPLFQAVRDEGRWSMPYASLHGHAWADAVIGGASLAFTGLAFLLAFLIAGLFSLIGLDQVERLVTQRGFGLALAGFAFGAAAGLLRERDRLLPLLLRLVRAVLSVLAPPLAIALVLFLASIPFTGLDEFWRSGVPATPLLLVAGAGAIILANSVFAEDADSRLESPVLRWSALSLVAVVLPLALIAAVSIGIRVGQYGWTPERIWGVVAVGVAIAYGLAGWYSIFRGRFAFDEPLRPLQTSLAAALCALALILALPVLDFGAISARSQLERLESGRVEPARFDWTAMAFDFGPAGRSQLRRIAKEGPADLRRFASTALQAKDRWALDGGGLTAGPAPTEIIVHPADADVPADLRDLLFREADGRSALCSQGGACRVYPQPGGAFVAIMDGCANLPPAEADNPNISCHRLPRVYEKRNGKWADIFYPLATVERGHPANDSMETRNLLRAEREALERGDVAIEPVMARQLVIGGSPTGHPFR